MLKMTSEEMKSKLIILAIAPAKIIPKEMCLDSFNYASRNDPVPKLDVAGYAKFGNELIWLDPHPNAKFHDHNFDSPTFEPVIRLQTQDITDLYGG